MVPDGELWLDGGAMFGVVPKPLWSKKAPADEQNRIRLSMNPLLIFTDPLILIDSGVSNKSDEKMKDIYRIDGGGLLGSLEELGVRPEDIGLVINTHLHFDHAGGNTWRFEDGILPTFPNARYLVQKAEWEDAMNPNERTKASYLRENLEPIKDRIEVLEGEKEVVPGVKVIPTGGHTRGHQVVRIESQGMVGVYLGDLIPTTGHISLPYIMAYDLFPLETLKKKKKLLAQAAENNWTLFFEHDPKITSGRVKLVEGRYRLLPAG